MGTEPMIFFQKINFKTQKTLHKITEIHAITYRICEIIHEIFLLDIFPRDNL